MFHHPTTIDDPTGTDTTFTYWFPRYACPESELVMICYHGPS